MQATGVPETSQRHPTVRFLVSDPSHVRRMMLSLLLSVRRSIPHPSLSAVAEYVPALTDIVSMSDSLYIAERSSSVIAPRGWRRTPP